MTIFWTQDEYQKFIEEVADKEVSFYAFEMIYWTGIREGELLALSKSDFDFAKGTVTISKSYQKSTFDKMLLNITSQESLKI